LTEERYYKLAKDKKSIESVQKYLELYPNGKYKVEIDSLCEHISYREITEIDLFNTEKLSESEKDKLILLSKQYISNFPESKNLTKVKDRIAFLDFYEKQTITQAEKYVKNFPNGMFYSQIISLLWNSDVKQNQEFAKKEITNIIKNRNIQHIILPGVTHEIFLAKSILPINERLSLDKIREANIYLNLDMSMNDVKSFLSILDLINRLNSNKDHYISTFNSFGIKINMKKLTRFIILMDFVGYDINLSQGSVSKYSFDVPVTTSVRVSCNVTIIDTQNYGVVFDDSVSASGSFVEYVSKYLGFAMAKSSEANDRMFEDLLGKLSNLGK